MSFFDSKSGRRVAQFVVASSLFWGASGGLAGQKKKMAAIKKEAVVEKAPLIEDPTAYFWQGKFSCQKNSSGARRPYGTKGVDVDIYEGAEPLIHVSITGGDLDTLALESLASLPQNAGAREVLGKKVAVVAVAFITMTEAVCAVSEGRSPSRKEGNVPSAFIEELSHD